MRRSKLVAFGQSLLILSSASSQAQNCFDPPANPMSQQPADWKRLIDWKPTTTNPAVVELQRIADGRGSNINLDYYAYTFRKHPTRTIQEVFQRTRMSFEIYARGSKRDPGQQYFLPYRAGSVPDEVQKESARRWASLRPEGALMTFVLVGLQPVLVMKATLNGLGVVLEQGDVLATCSTDLDFIFTTARTMSGDWHPVSGNRGFGMRDNGDATWTFYTMAADRRAPYLNGRIAEVIARGRNASHPFESNQPDPSEEIYLKGQEFWKVFFAAMIDDFDKQGMTLVRETVNSRRYAYPLSGP